MTTPTSCPYCEWRPAEADIESAMREHILRCHRDRIEALRVYRATLATGADEATARAAYNRAILHRGPGQHERISA